MTQVYYRNVIDAPAENVWEIIRDFGSLPIWCPFVESSMLSNGGAPGQVGTIRSNTFSNGKITEEKLLELSDRDRRMVYSIVGGDVPTLDYSATITVHTVVDGNRSFVAWSATF